MAVQYNSKDNSWSGIGVDVFDAIKDKILGVKQELPEISKDVKDFFDICNTDVELKALDSDGLIKWANDVGLADESLISFLQDTEYSEKTLANYQLYLKNTAKTTTLFQRATKAAGTAAKTLIANLASTAVAWAVAWAVAAVIRFIYNFVDRIIVTMDELNDKIEENRELYKETAKEIDSLNSELENTKERIDELNALDKLSFTEKDELDNLKKQNVELEKNIRLKEEINKAALKDTITEYTKKYASKKYANNKNNELKDEAFDYYDDIQYYKNEIAETFANWQGLVEEEITLDNYRDILGEFPGTVDLIDQYLAEISRYETLLLGKKGKIDTVEDKISGLQQAIDDYETYGIENLTSEERMGYDKVLKALNNYYKYYLSEGAYEEIQINPVFDSDPQLNGLKDKIIEFFSSGKTIDDLSNGFENSLIEALKKACENLDVDYDSLIDFLYGEGTNNYDKDNVVKVVSDNLNNAKEVYRVKYGDVSVDDFNNRLSQIINDMDVPTLRAFISFSSKNGKNYDTIEAFVEDFYKTIENSEEKSKNISVSSLLSSNKDALDKYSSSLDTISKALNNNDLSSSDLMQIMRENASFDWKKYGVTGKAGVGQVNEALRELANTLNNDLLKKFPELNAQINALFDEKIGNSIVSKFEKLSYWFKEIQSERVFSESEIQHLLKIYPDLAEKINVVAEGYTIEKDALKSLMETVSTESKAYIIATQNKTKVALKETENRIKALKIEAEAMTALIEQYNSVNSLTVEDLMYDYGFTRDKAEETLKAIDSYDRITWTLNECEKKLKEIKNVTRDEFEDIIENLNQTIEEAEYLINLLSFKNLLDKKGEYTDEGLTTLSLRKTKYNTYISEATRYAKELSKVQNELALDPMNQTLIDRERELQKAQRDSILSAQKEKQAMIDLAQEGIKKQIDYLNDLIDKKKEALEVEKNLYDFQKSITEQTNTIAKLKKQISVAELDDSEEGKKNLQSLRDKLKETQEKLKDSQYDRWVEEQNKILDKLIDNYTNLQNESIAAIDSKFDELIALVASNADIINNTLQSIANGVISKELIASKSTNQNKNTDSVTNRNTPYNDNNTNNVSSNSPNNNLEKAAEAIGSVGDKITSATGRWYSTASGGNSGSVDRYSPDYWIIDAIREDKEYPYHIQAYVRGKAAGGNGWVKGAQIGYKNGLKRANRAHNHLIQMYH